MAEPAIWSAIWTIGGPTLGLFIGAYLTRSWDRNKWLNDNRKEEYRSLLTTLTESSLSIRNSGSSPEDGILYLERETAFTKFHRVVHDRIFIAAEIEEMKLVERWDHAMNRLLKAADVRNARAKATPFGTADTRDLVKTFDLELAEIRKSVVSAAIKTSPLWSDIADLAGRIRKALDEMDERN